VRTITPMATSTETNVDIQQAIPVFRDLPEEDLRQLLGLLTERSFAAGEEINQPNRQQDGLTAGYLVLSGQVQLSLRDEEGRYVPLDIVGAGEYFGEHALGTGEPRQLTARALTDVTAVELDRDVLFAFLERHPASARHAIEALARRLRETEHLLEYRASQNPNLVDEKQVSVWQRIADVIADFSGTLIFLAINILLFAAWMIVNLPGSPLVFDPFPFSFLGMVVSLEAILLSIFVLISQNRQARKDHIKADLDYQVNLKAELEIGLILKQLTELQNRVELLQQDQERMHKLVVSGQWGSRPPTIDHQPLTTDH
jgi:CRP/FNR family cyclic AMP-dependent transcriptional regulator